MISNCPLSQRVESPGKQKAVDCGVAINVQYYDYTSSPSQLSACRFCTISSQCLAGFPQAPLARPWVAVHYGNLSVWKSHGICCQETRWSVRAVPLST